ncbi:ATP-binding protein [Gemmiger sp.]
MQTELRVPLNTDFTARILAFLDDCLADLGTSVPAKQANRLRIAADEVSANISSYSGATEVTCRFAVQDDSISVTFCDNGIPYDPLTQKAPDTTASVEERAVGGLGLFLVKKLMDDVRYQYRDAQNILTLSIRLC